MFIGHYSAALVAATHRRAPGLGLLFVAAQFVDFAFFGLSLASIERFRIVPGITAVSPLDLYHMPYTHSLLGSAIFAIIFAALVWFATRNRVAAILGGAVVLSHWFLDLLVHRPDLTLAGAPPKFGLGLWDSPAIEIPLELALTFGALAFYIMRTRPAAPRGGFSVTLLALLLLALGLINWFGPPPTEVRAAALTGLLAFAILAGAAYWVGINRQLKAAYLQ
ncbi:MAG: hypothetical protein U5J78_07600 [Parasphingorhabdus sp.]|nr:hypothetical protein [Parasphingorhabdus sp.]